MTPEQLNQISQALVNVAVAVLTVLAPVLAGMLALKVRQWLADKQLLQMARESVLAAEQLSIAKQITDKKTYAVELLKSALARRGVNVPVGELSLAIEAAVMAEFNRP